MSEPANTQPAACPRIDGTSGPRRCPFVECRHHTWEVSKFAGQRTSALRVLAQRECPDTCALDVAERAHAVAFDRELDDRAPRVDRRRVACTEREIGVMLAMAPSNVHRTLVRAQRKFRARMGELIAASR